MALNQQNSFVTLGGECFQVEFQRTVVDIHRDGVFYHFHMTDLKSGRGKRLVSLVIPTDSPGLENARLNTIRRAFDSGAFSFDDPHDQITYRELPFTADDLRPQPRASETEIRQLIMNEAYWLSWKLGGRQPVQSDSPVDLDYLGVAAGVIQQNQWFLERKGMLVESKVAGLGRPTEKLIEVCESSQVTQATSELVFPPKSQYTAFKAITNIFQSAKKEILIVDNYLDADILDMLAALPSKPAVRILTHKPNANFKVAVTRFVSQYGGSIDVRLHAAQIHDRAIVIDDMEFYALGGSIKDLGKNLSLMNKLADPSAIGTLRATLAGIWGSASVL
ncbi:MAG: hypothetical protein WB780_03690 [Candidatus Acidiferrales bacterium]